MSETRVKPLNGSSQTLRGNIEGMMLRLPNYTFQVKFRVFTHEASGIGREEWFTKCTTKVFTGKKLKIHYQCFYMKKIEGEEGLVR